MGVLEAEVLARLWAAEAPVTPGDVAKVVDGAPAYTTVMTVLTRLWKKGLVDREPRGRAYAYRPAVSEAELAARRMHETLDRAVDREGALARFVGTLRSGDETVLRRALASPD